MSGARELKQLVLMIDEHRNNIGNSQYSFEPYSESREVLARFARTAHRILGESFDRIKYHWELSLIWDTNEPKKLVENTAIYTWSIAHKCSYNPPEEKIFREVTTTEMTACLLKLEEALSQTPVDVKLAVKDAAVNAFMQEMDRVLAIIRGRNTK